MYQIQDSFIRKAQGSLILKIVERKKRADEKQIKASRLGDLGWKRFRGVAKGSIESMEGKVRSWSIKKQQGLIGIKLPKTEKGGEILESLT